MDSTISLLEQIKILLALRTENRNSFNVFSALNRESDEKNVHCLMLYKLLSSDGGHGKGNAFLELFFNHVLKRPMPRHNVRVYREYSIDNYSTETGRIDLLIDDFYLVEYTEFYKI